MYTKTAIAKSVSVSEMQTMRQEGMTNREIAESLDISYQYVLKAIGSQPRELTSRARSEGQIARHQAVPAKHTAPLLPAVIPVPQAAPVEPDEQETVLLIEERITRACGFSGALYELSSKAGTVTLTLADRSVVIPFQELDNIIRELRTVKAHAKESTFEGWT